MVPTVPDAAQCHQCCHHISLAGTETFFMFSLTKDAHVFPPTNCMQHVQTCLLSNMTLQMTINQSLLNFTSPLCLSLQRAIQAICQFVGHCRICDMACSLFYCAVLTPLHSSMVATIATPGKNPITFQHTHNCCVNWHCPVFFGKIDS